MIIVQIDLYIVTLISNHTRLFIAVAALGCHAACCLPSITSLMLPELKVINKCWPHLNARVHKGLKEITTRAFIQGNTVCATRCLTSAIALRAIAEWPYFSSPKYTVRLYLNKTSIKTKCLCFKDLRFYCTQVCVLYLYRNDEYQWRWTMFWNDYYVHMCVWIPRTFVQRHLASLNWEHAVRVPSQEEGKRRRTKVWLVADPPSEWGPPLLRREHLWEKPLGMGVTLVAVAADEESASSTPPYLLGVAQELQDREEISTCMRIIVIHTDRLRHSGTVSWYERSQRWDHGGLLLFNYTTFHLQYNPPSLPWPPLGLA